MVNIITLIMIMLFALPMLTGAFRTVSKEKLTGTLFSFVANVEFLVVMILSFLMTRWIFFTESSILRVIYMILPEDWKKFLDGQDMLTYLIVVPIIAFFLFFGFRFPLVAFYKNIIMPASDNINAKFEKVQPLTRSVFNGLYQLPRSLSLILFYGLMLNLYAYYTYSPSLTKQINESAIYQFMYETTISNMLSPNMAKQISVINNSSFKKEPSKADPAKSDPKKTDSDFALNLGEKITGKNFKISEYLNGVSLNDAVKSMSEIDLTAKKIVGSERKARAKANKIYNWITSNVKYDNDKAIKLGRDPRGISSSSVIAFTTRKGICFDYACLYVTMCRAVGVKVRFMIGLAYSGISWGDHAWNQVYINEEKKWISVDTTFGISANYFDKSDFNADHTDESVLAEW